MQPKTASAPKPAARAKNPLARLPELGQSVWLDYIRRSLLDSGDLARLVENDDLRGVTSNPAIFEKAIAGSRDYQAALAALGESCAIDAQGVYETLAIEDVRRAADVLRPVYVRTSRKDGYVSLEVSPKLAHDTQGTLDEARRLWKSVARENLMIKVPATKAGLPAIRALIAEGINVNVTLLFAVDAYLEVAEAYIAGLEDHARAGGDLTRVASVASFFVSRIDSAVDPLLESFARGTGPVADRALARSLVGQVAVANAKLAYQAFSDLVRTPRWASLAKRGAQSQRLLWASTGTKDARFRDVLYVEELVGADTVDTIPPATYDAFRDHGRVRASLVEDVAHAHEIVEALPRFGIDFRSVQTQLLGEGLELFVDAFDKLLAAVVAQAPAHRVALPRFEARLNEALRTSVDATLADWQQNDKTNRLWQGDSTLWTNADESKWLGWLGVVERGLHDAEIYERFAASVRAQGFHQVVLLGMGGSSLAPEVLSRTFGRAQGAPEFLMLDSTDPEQVRALESRIDFKTALFVVSSKSGSTLEPNNFKEYFLARAKLALGDAKAPTHFVAVTDRGSMMEQVAEGERFWKVFHGLASVGGRYSALSNFGLVPAAAMGIDVRTLLARADEMVHACAGCVAPADNPGVLLGAILGNAALQGRDKVTIVTPNGLVAVGAWLEQLLAESTGKRGQGLVPVDLEPLGAPSVYGQDRVFVHLALAGEDAPEVEARLVALEKDGHPVVRITLRDAFDVGAEFFRFEFATAVAGSVLGINPFDQPDVEASKIATKRLTAAYDATGSLPLETPVFAAEGIQLFADERNATEIAARVGPKKTLDACLRAHLSRVGLGDYVALLAYVEMNAPNMAALDAQRVLVRDSKRVATCVGFGPRFLHSTGQAYKGGPASGVFLQITCDDARDLAIPGRRATFGVVKSAQARGDFAVLSERGRRALRVHLGSDVRAGLATLGAALRRALA